MFLCLSRYLCIFHLYFTRCGWIYNNHIIANCPQSVLVKNLENLSIIDEDIDKQSATLLLAHSVESSSSYIHIMKS